MLTEGYVGSYNIVLFGGNGDLAMRKLLPALYRLYSYNNLTLEGCIIGASRTELSRTEYEDLVHRNLQIHLDTDELDPVKWEGFRQKLRYARVDANDRSSFDVLKAMTQDSAVQRNMYYFSTSPSLFGSICSNLNTSGLVDRHSRVVLEKPIGEDLASSQVINDEVAKYFEECQIYRIDHYLGKETVQNLLSVRFANALFEPLWNSNAIDHVQITVAETVGVEGRWSYYDRAGALRDMVQNHLLQLLCLVAMEPPSSMDADAVRDEKLKVLKSLRTITSDEVNQKTVRGQYRPGAVNGKPVPGYIDEGGDGADSNTETFVALRAEIDNWRWAGVPFYLRTGKRMPVRYSEIVIQFKSVPHSIFNDDGNAIAQNKLIIRLQPEESIQLVMMNKVPGLEESMKLRAVPLNLSLTEAFDNPRTPAAYERLLLDVIRDNQTLFMRRDEIEAAWRWIDQIHHGWRVTMDRPKSYTAGSWGPAAAVALIVRDGQNWHD
ncbi:glucose-6-phosphate dehydrogenase [Pseudobacteriovorax antillogorgiicola]|uniref:Glucose-6-phosphate 1-dehydrogenase n=1 Tax=Pseudobacteriovorax antillogorgiicola TaxID=1513793 RepID=A0A1Y6BM75_9BACT|nr:glucose-6-phosphate dehydrogenase [Pseudobacteriovorax antillogorgiicola]TCS55576.1 glucose-6-phosphate 1-dehydrogenase [Pseudobacteriovorax antillogorgiicola]SMF10679.1 glucose-6-phosphate 1-dehydrogenase [Pseudobacteriovorax antillogorgiicola]